MDYSGYLFFTFVVVPLMYVLFGGLLQVAVGLVAAPIFFLVARLRSHAPYARLFRAYLVFNACLLFWSCVGNELFFLLTYGHLYVSADYSGDWYPFIPFGQWALDVSLGPLHSYLIGSAKLWELRVIWFIIAVLVWLLTYVSTVWVLRRRLPWFARVPFLHRAA